MKKTIALILLICIVAVAIYSCNDNNETTPNIPTSESSKIASGENISDSSLVSSEVFSSNVNSSEADNNDSSVSSSDESDTESEITSIPDESNDDENSSESSFPHESEDIPDTSSETSSETTSKPSHTCQFKKIKTVESTCTATGYTLYSCSCGKEEKRDYTSPLGHIEGEWITIKEATTSSTGLKKRYCTDCGAELSEKVIDKIGSEEEEYNVPATADNAKLVEERVLYYLNQYRNADGVSSATFLWNGKTYKYAKMRAEQIVDNFEHDRDDIIEVCNELKFGAYMLNTEYIEGSGIVEPYYYGGCSEAITGPYGATSSRTVDDLALDVASNIHASSGHWNYVGAETTKHLTIGCYAFVWGGEADFYFCIATSTSDKYD